MGKLSTEVQQAIIQRLACYDSPSEVRDAIREEFSIEVTLPQVLYYDPTSASTNLAPEWRDLFEHTRAEFLATATSVAIAHKAVRLRRLDRMYGKASQVKNYALAASLLEQAAKEVGGAFTNRREMSGPNGGPIPVEDTTLTDEQRLAKLTALLDRARSRAAATTPARARGKATRRAPRRRR